MSPVPGPLASTSLQRLHHRLRQGHALTQDEMAAELDVTKRQARRLVQQLRDEGVPVEERLRGRKKEYLLPPEAQHGATIPLDLTEEQALALVVAAASAQSGQRAIPMGPALREAFEQIVGALPDQVRTFEPKLLLDHLHFGTAASVRIDPSVFLALLKAILNRRAVAIDYYAAYNDTDHHGRVIYPYGLARRGDAWQCVARDPAKPEGEDMRDFNLARISAVRRADPESLGGDYSIPEDFNFADYFRDRFESLDGETMYTVTLRVDAEVASYFESKDYHRTQQMHDGVDEDGSREVSYEVAGLKEIASFVRSWGPKVEVVSPPELKARIAADARAVIARYEDPE